jgi:hypothetical protein
MNGATRPECCPSDLRFDQYTAGELDASTRRPFEEHTRRCPRCLERMRALDAQREAFLGEASNMPALASLVGPGHATVPRPRRIVHRGAGIAGVLALAASFLIVLKLQPEPHPPDGVRTKGAARLAFFVKRGALVSRGRSGNPLQPGDVVRFIYSSERAAYLALINLDARGVTTYFPSGSGTARQVGAGTDVALDFGVELDRNPGEERVFGVFCPAPFALAPLTAALEADKALPELPGCDVDELVLNKQTTP